MSTVVGQVSNYAELDFAFGVDVSSAGAVVTVHGDNWTCTKTGGAVGQYTFVYNNRQGVMLKEIFSSGCDWRTAAVSALQPQILSIVQAGGRDGLDITVVVQFKSAADTGVAGTVSGWFANKCAGGTFTSPL